MLLARVCIEDPTTFRCFFKLFSKKVTINVISDKDVNFKQKIDALKNEGHKVIVFDNNSTQEEFDNSAKDFFQKLNSC